MLRCGRCGATEHANCQGRRPAPCYWYCRSCTEVIEHDGPADITEDVPALLFLLGGSRPPTYSPESAQQLESFYVVRRGLLLAECTGGYRVYPTAVDRAALIEQYHHSLMHAGWRATTEALKSRYYWPSLEADTRGFCRSCLAC